MVNKWCGVPLTILLAACWYGVGHAGERVIPLPRLKPIAAIASKPAGNINFPALAILDGWSGATVVAERKECAKRLQGLKVEYEALSPIGNETGCGAAAPLKVSSIAGVSIVPPAELTCDMTEALHAWISSSALPAARELLQKQLVQINNATAYACRRRNGLATGKLSEHAKANALDIATLKFSDGAVTNIKGDWSGVTQLLGASAKGDFLRRLRRDACIRFTTVLGPGSDRYHGDHFHVDVARRKNGYRICK
jgi:hypothetical protein